MAKGIDQNSSLVMMLLTLILALLKKIQDLEAKLGKNSSNSSRPPSSDSPYTRDKDRQKNKPKTEKKPGGQPGHQGHGPKLLPPTEQKDLHPQECTCGCTDFEDLGVFYTHQEVELPKIDLLVYHFLLHQGRCKHCGKIFKAKISNGHTTGYGPKISALIALLSGDHGDSRRTVQRFCRQFLLLDISIGTIQKVLNRVSKAINPHYEEIKAFVQVQEINHVDETPWYQKHGVLHWLWVLCNKKAAFFKIHTNRNAEAFKALIGRWAGILVSDNYAVYSKWVNLRQTCLAHLIRTAKGLSKNDDPEIAKFGIWAAKELKLLVHMAHAPPTNGQWCAFYARLCRLIALNRDREDQAGTYARTLEKLLGNLWIFLEVAGVDATNNLAERMLRAAVLWRKRSFGTESDSGDRWVERILTVTQTCRLQNKLTYPVLVDAMNAYLFGKEPDLKWIKEL